MGHKAHPTSKPKQLQDTNEQNTTIKHEYDAGVTYTIEHLSDSCLLKVTKNGELLTIDGIYTIVE